MRFLFGVGVLLGQTLSLSALWREYRYYAQTHDLIEGSDGWYGQAESGAIYRIPATLQAETLDKAPPFDRWIPMPNGQGWIAWENLRRGFRHSSYGSLRWKVGEKRLTLPGTHWKEAEALPQGTALVAADTANLYLFRLEKNRWDTLTRYTGPVQAGTTDWLYEEEFGFTKAFAVSPSGAYLAYLVLDNRATPTYPLTYHGKGYPTTSFLPYPRAGERNPTVSLYLLPLSTGQPTRLWIDSTGGYIPWFSWSPMGDELYFVQLNRPQNHFTLYRYEVGQAAPTPFFRDSTEGFFTWDDRHLIVWNPDQPELYYLASGKGPAEIWRYDYKGRRLAVYKVPGLRTLIGCAAGKLFFHAAGEAPIHQRVGYLPLTQKNPAPVWLTSPTGWVEARLAGEVLYLQYSRFDSPYKEEMRSARMPEKALPLPDLNTHLRSQRLPVQVRFVRVPGPAGDLWGYLLLPQPFDSTRLYPVLFTFYGGPGSQQVSDEFMNLSFYWQAYMVKQGYLVACMDGRGTALYPDKRFSIYRQLGLPETEDMVAFLRWLKGLPYVGKVGAFGWSYGGYMALRLAFAAPDALAAAVAVAPVTDWRLYDTAYTERFMDTPEHNPTGYERTALPPANTPLRVPTLLLHGDADDNVHVQNAYRFLEKLLRTQPDAPIDWRIFPNQNHGLPAYRYRVYWEIEQFLSQHLR